MDLKTVLVDALEKKYEAQLAEAEATMKIYFESRVGIGEHPQHIEEMDKLLTKIVDAEEKLKAVKLYR